MASLLDDDPEWSKTAAMAASESFKTGDTYLDWWLTFAAEAAKLGVDKNEYNGWVTNHYASDEPRFTASVAWDIVKLGEASD